MSLTEQNDQPRSKRPSLIRTIAVGSAALFLLSTAYQVKSAAAATDYDNGLSTGEAVGIAVGAAGGAYLLWLLLGADKKDEAATEATYAPGLTSGTKAASARLITPSGKYAAGESAVFDLQVQRGNRWESVTNERGSSIRVSGAPLTQLDGAKNAFAVPMTASSGTVVAVGQYTQPDGSVLTAQKMVSVGG